MSNNKTREQILREEEKLPKYLCWSCKKMSEGRCYVFNRRVEPSYNRCAYHSNYIPELFRYTTPDTLKAETTERARKANAA